MVSVSASPVAVRYKEGLVHGFLVLTTLDGATVADGDALQTVHGDQVTDRVIYHFRDGSLQDETTVFSQHASFHLISYRLVQKGPAFRHASDLSIRTDSGLVTVHYTDDDGKEKDDAEHMKLPADLANGLVPTLLKDLRPQARPLEVSMVVAAPKPRLVKLAITAQGEEPFSLGTSTRKATRYVVKVEIGGLAGVVAPLVGKQPPDSHIWILGGVAPTFVKSEVLSYMGGPMWRTELLAPAWPRATESKNELPAKP